MNNLGKILLVDDDTTSQFISKRLLDRMNAATQISMAKNGLDALEMVKTEPFDVILLDINIPKMDGFEFLDTLKRLQESAGMQVPAVVILTTSANRVDKTRAKDYDVKAYLEKPLTQESIRYLAELVAKNTE